MGTNGYNTLNYEKQGGAVWVVGGELTLESTGKIITAANVGAASTGVTAVEYGNGFDHKTVLTLATTLPAIAGGASLGVGLARLSHDCCRTLEQRGVDAF